MHLCLTVWPQGRTCWKIEVIRSLMWSVIPLQHPPGVQCPAHWTVTWHPYPSITSATNCIPGGTVQHTSLNVQNVGSRSEYIHLCFIHAPQTGSVQRCFCVCLCDGWSWRWPLLRAVTGEGLPVTPGHLGTLITSLSFLLLSALLKATVQPQPPLPAPPFIASLL